MKKLSLVLAVLMLVSVFALSVSAKSGSYEFEINIDDQTEENKYIVEDTSNGVIENDGDRYREIPYNCRVVYKFTVPEGTTSATVSLPVAQSSTVYATCDLNADQATWQKLYDFDDQEIYSLYEPQITAHEITVTGTEVYVIVTCEDDTNYASIWTAAQAVQYGTKYANRQWNIALGYDKNQTPDADHPDAHDPAIVYEGTAYYGYEGKITFTYEYTETAPQTGDAIVAAMTVAVIAGAALVVCKKH